LFIRRYRLWILPKPCVNVFSSLHRPFQNDVILHNHLL
jgi:hypothetical protein